jgi:uncharacterized integral membrane protein (TIGR00698 family)
MNRIIVFNIIVLLAFFSIAPHWSILAGIALSFVLKFSPTDQRLIKSWSSKILQGSIILLGSALNFHMVLNQGPAGILVTFTSLVLVLISGELLARFLKVPSPLSNLISVGTAICGGSAIGAVSPVLKADNLSIAVAMGIVFILNAIAVFVFPVIGHALELTQVQFGTWAALAIHDTSAVVAASAAFGDEALKLATMLKLTRALWIIPVALMFTLSRKSHTKLSFPWFIVFFIVMSVLFSWITDLQPLIPYFKNFARSGFTITLFLIGLSLNREQLKTIEGKTIALGLSLWILTLSGSLIYVYYFVKG